MSVRGEFDYDYDEVADLRQDLDELATQARADAVTTETFTEALERRLARCHAPREGAVSTGGAAARKPPSQPSKGDSDNKPSVDEGDGHKPSVDDGDGHKPFVDEGGDDKLPVDDGNGSKLSVDEGDDDKPSVDKNSENTLSSDEIDEIRLSIGDIRDESATIQRLLARKSSLSTDDLAVVASLNA